MTSSSSKLYHGIINSIKPYPQTFKNNICDNNKTIPLGDSSTTQSNKNKIYKISKKLKMELTRGFYEKSYPLIVWGISNSLLTVSFEGDPYHQFSNL